jgi:hypothetical protein
MEKEEGIRCFDISIRDVLIFILLQNERLFWIMGICYVFEGIF